jgi:hypothetical protein
MSPFIVPTCGTTRESTLCFLDQHYNYTLIEKLLHYISQNYYELRDTGVHLSIADWSLSIFLSPFIRFFLTLTSQLKPCGYFTYLIMMLHVSSSPNLYTTALTVLRNDLHDLRKWRKCKLAFPSVGCRWWGWVYKNQNQNEYQMAEPCGYCTCLIMMKHVQFSPNLYATALTVLRNVLRDLQAWRTCKLAGPSACWTLQW